MDQRRRLIAYRFHRARTGGRMAPGFRLRPRLAVREDFPRDFFTTGVNFGLEGA
jgi:hypothetical protein